MAVIVSESDVVGVERPRPHHNFEWSPVILGALGATAISFVLLTFGAALGLSVVSPYPYAGISARGLAVLAGTYTALVVVASFAAGGYLAGRLRAPPPGERATADLVEHHFRDGAHGFGVWALAVLLGAALAMSGAGAALKTAAQASTTVAAADMAGAAANPALSMSPTDYAVDRLLAPGPMAAGMPANTMMTPTPRGALAAPITRALATNIGNPQLDARDRTALVQIVMQQTGLPQADAEKRVDDAFAELKAAERKVRDAAEQARRAALIAAFVAAATLAIGCAAACAAASLGARHRDERTLVSLFGAQRFW